MISNTAQNRPTFKSNFMCPGGVASAGKELATMTELTNRAAKGEFNIVAYTQKFNTPTFVANNGDTITVMSRKAAEGVAIAPRASIVLQNPRQSIMINSPEIETDKQKNIYNTMAEAFMALVPKDRK